MVSSDAWVGLLNCTLLDDHRFGATRSRLPASGSDNLCSINRPGLSAVVSKAATAKPGDEATRGDVLLIVICTEDS